HESAQEQEDDRVRVGRGRRADRRNAEQWKEQEWRESSGGNRHRLRDPPPRHEYADRRSPPRTGAHARGRVEQQQDDEDDRTAEQADALASAYDAISGQECSRAGSVQYAGAGTRVPEQGSSRRSP